MTFSRAVVVLLISGWFTASASAEAGEGTTELAPELQSAMTDRQRANLGGDTEKIESLIADEYVQTDIFGRVQNKTEWLADYFKPLAILIKTGQFHWDMWEEKDVQIRQFSDVVVVVGRLTLKGSGASPVPGHGWVASPQAIFGPTALRFTRVWMKRNGKWLLVAIHNAAVSDQVKK